jgi:hypothetical protein
MKGKVYMIKNGLVFVHHSDGQISWFRSHEEDSIEINDILQGELRSDSVTELINETKGKKLKVFIEGHT